MANSDAMSGIRTLLSRRATLIALMLAVVLAMRALVPTGYMAASSSTGLTIELCSGVAGKSVMLSLPGVPGQHHDDKAKADMPCAFSTAGFDHASPIDPVLLAGAIAFIVALGFLALKPRRTSTRSYLRPPLRGPPLA